MKLTALKNIIRTESRQNLALFLGFWLLTFVLYMLAWRGGMEKDFQGWLEMYFDKDFAGAMTREGAGIQSLYYVTQLQLYFWTSVFGTHLVPWFLLFVSLQAWVCILLFRFLALLFQTFSLPRAKRVALAGVLLFAVSHSLAEVIIWKACYHYLVGVIMMLSVLIWLAKYTVSLENRYVWQACILYFIASFTLEYFYLIPVMVLTLIFCYFRAGLINSAAAKKSFFRFGLPLVGLLLLHFALYKIIFSGNIPHAEDSVADALANPAIALGRIVSYQFHLLAFGRFWPQDMRFALYRFSETPWFAWSLSAVLLGVGVLLLARFRQLGSYGRLFTILYWFVAMTMGLVLPYYIYEIQHLAGDRYVYFIAAFEFPLLALAFFWLLRKPILAWTMSAIFGGAMAYFTLFTAYEYRQAAKVFWGLQENFPATNGAETLVILNLPASYNGMPLFDSNHDYPAIPQYLHVFQHREITAKTYLGSGHNMVTIDDGVKATVLSDSTIQGEPDRRWHLVLERHPWRRQL